MVNCVGVLQDGPRDELSAESHSFCEIFTGAFYDAIVNVFKSGEERTPEALSQAAEQMGRVLTLGTQMANPARARYHDVAQAMLAAEQALYGGQHHEALAAALTGRGLAVRWVRLPEVRSAGGSVVGLGRFELPASSSRTKRAAKLRHSP